MKRILLILSLALAFVACKKEDSGEYLDKLLYAGADIKFTHNSEPIQSLYFNKEKGGTITIETNVDAFILGLGIYTEGVSDGKLFYTSSPPDFILKFEDIIKCKEYLYKCCKIIPPSLPQISAQSSVFGPQEPLAASSTKFRIRAILSKGRIFHILPVSTWLCW